MKKILILYTIQQRSEQSFGLPSARVTQRKKKYIKILSKLLAFNNS